MADNNAVQWKVSSLERTLPDGDVYPEGKVCVAFWQASYEEGDQTASCYGNVVFGDADPQQYTPYSQLTEEQVLQWIFESLGPDKVVTIQEDLYRQVQEALNPTYANGVPW